MSEKISFWLNRMVSDILLLTKLPSVTPTQEARRNGRGYPSPLYRRRKRRNEQPRTSSPLHWHGKRRNERSRIPVLNSHGPWHPHLYTDVEVQKNRIPPFTLTWIPGWNKCPSTLPSIQTSMKSQRHKWSRTPHFKLTLPLTSSPLHNEGTNDPGLPPFKLTGPGHPPTYTDVENEGTNDPGLPLLNWLGPWLPPLYTVSGLPSFKLTWPRRLSPIYTDMGNKGTNDPGLPPQSIQTAHVLLTCMTNGPFSTMM